MLPEICSYHWGLLLPPELRNVRFMKTLFGPVWSTRQDRQCLSWNVVNCVLLWRVSGICVTLVERLEREHTSKFLTNQHYGCIILIYECWPVLSLKACFCNLSICIWRLFSSSVLLILRVMTRHVGIVHPGIYVFSATSCVSRSSKADPKLTNCGETASIPLSVFTHSSSTSEEKFCYTEKIWLMNYTCICKMICLT